ncbi:MAG: hypothetical protein AB9869_02205 [Verrucomicrobiia bacterium]
MKRVRRKDRIPTEVAWAFALGHSSAADKNGNQYEAVDLDDDARMALGARLCQRMAGKGKHELAGQLWDELSKRWPGRFQARVKGQTVKAVGCIDLDAPPQLAIPPEAALMIALGASTAVDGKGNVYPVPPGLPDDERILLGEILLQHVASLGEYQAVARVQRELAKAWPGHFTHGLDRPRYSRREFIRGIAHE